MIVRNKDQRSRDYGNIAQTYRPGHADFGFDSKYGFRDYRGGGRSSGRETIGRVAAGAIAARILKELGITLQAYTSSIGPVSCQSYHPAIIPEKLFLYARYGCRRKSSQVSGEMHERGGQCRRCCRVPYKRRSCWHWRSCIWKTRCSFLPRH